LTNKRLDQQRKDRMNIPTRMMLVAIGTSFGSTCSRRAVGCVLTSSNIVVATGYNGSPRGMTHCISKGCLTNEAGACINCVHAELNACLQCIGPADTAYCTDTPCLTCLRALLNKGVRTVFFWRHYEDEDRDLFLENAQFGPEGFAMFNMTSAHESLFNGYWKMLESCLEKYPKYFGENK
jgi:dCMP deaminase